MASRVAIYFEPDAYELTGRKLMGRQAAGHAFLKAAARANSEGQLWAYASDAGKARAFESLISGFAPNVQSNWVALDDVEGLAKVGLVYFAHPLLGDPARLRLRAGPAAYSIVGITHTTASHSAMDAIRETVTAPVFPWDAMICTSSAVENTIRTVLEAELDYLRWRLGEKQRVNLPIFATIPLGVHCEDFAFTAEARARARAALRLADDEIAVLFVGRLSMHAKAHPHMAYRALQRVARETGKRIAFVQTGWFANDAIRDAFEDGAQQFCPDVRALFSDGRDNAQRRDSWAAADIFLSLSDNIQETFGLTPLEAMAAGLPTVVSDWDGYRDTVKDGVSGFRIPTAMPAAGHGERFARGYEAGTRSYDFYSGLTCQTVSIDEGALVAKLRLLVEDASLRRRMGEAGRARARRHFDWARVYRAYERLWSGLARQRRMALKHEDVSAWLAKAPRVTPGRLDPFRLFAGYPTREISRQTRLCFAEGATVAEYRALREHPLFDYAKGVLPDPVLVAGMMAAAPEQGGTVEALARRVGAAPDEIVLAVAALAKMGLVRFLADA
jgi:glycosyltransferase involved in cell wall biosynthesis